MSKTLTNVGMVDFENITEEDIDPVTTGKALAKLTRFCGNFDNPMTVAQHAILVAQVVESEGGSYREQLAALHHDDCEAILGDVPAPVKRVCPHYLELEERIQDAIDDKYGIETRADIVKAADSEVGVAEMFWHCDMSPHLPRPMYTLKKLSATVMIASQALMPWPYEEVFAKWMDLHNILTRKISLSEAKKKELPEPAEEGSLN